MCFSGNTNTLEEAATDAADDSVPLGKLAGQPFYSGSVYYTSLLVRFDQLYIYLKIIEVICFDPPGKYQSYNSHCIL